MAFVLLHNDAGGVDAAAKAVRAAFQPDLIGAVRTSLDDLAANFQEPHHQGPVAYATQMLVDHPELDRDTLLADAVVAVASFHDQLFAMT